MNRIGIFRTLAGLAERETGVLHGATVLAQREDGRLDVRCDDEKLGSWSHVRIWSFTPNTKLRIKPRTRVLVGFYGVLRTPFALVFSGEGLEALEIGTNAKPAAREGDRVRVTLEPGAVQVMSPSGEPSTNPLPIVATGEIISGSGVVKLG